MNRTRLYGLTGCMLLATAAWADSSDQIRTGEVLPATPGSVPMPVFRLMPEESVSQDTLSQSLPRPAQLNFSTTPAAEQADSGREGNVVKGIACATIQNVLTLRYLEQRGPGYLYPEYQPGGMNTPVPGSGCVNPGSQGQGSRP
ncbi:MAG: hypothetical protein H7833_01485 [Magnetococcus sp. DMHC-1]|nr:hypothetical protein [Magnetococcales bacterium]